MPLASAPSMPMHSNRSPWCALCLLLSLAACNEKGDDDSGDASTLDATETAAEPTTGEPLPAGCECAEGDPCAVKLCEFPSRSEDFSSEVTLPDPAALKCTLEALRDRKIGRIGWSDSMGSGQFVTRQEIDMFGDGTARSTTGGAQDLCYITVDGVGFGTLKDPQVFEDCLSDPDVEAQFACIRTAFTEESTVCVEEEQNCDGI